MYPQEYFRRRVPASISPFNPEDEETRRLLAQSVYTRPRRANPPMPAFELEASRPVTYTRPRMVEEPADDLTKIAETRDYHANQNITNDDPWWKNMLSGGLMGLASGPSRSPGEAVGRFIGGAGLNLAMPATDDRFENQGEVAKLDDRYKREFGRQKATADLDEQVSTNYYRRAQAKKLSQPEPPKYQLKDTAEGTVAIDLNNPTAPPVKLGLKTKDSASSYSVQRGRDGRVYAVNTRDPKDVVTLPFEAEPGEDFVDVPGYGRMRASAAYNADRAAGESEVRGAERGHADAVSRWESAEREQAALVKAIGEMNEAIAKRGAAYKNGDPDAFNEWEEQARARKVTVEKLARALRGKYGDIVADDDEAWPTRLKPRPVYTRKAPTARVKPKDDPLGLFSR